MSLRVLNRKVNDLSGTGGSGDLVLLGQYSAGASNPDVLGNMVQSGDTIVLCLSDMAGNFEVATCTVTISQAGVVTIARTTVITSSNGGLACSFQGNVTVHNYVPAPLELVLFNLQFQALAQASLSQLASDVTDIKDGLTLILDNLTN